MNATAFLEDLADVLEVEPEELTPEFAFGEHNWDSLAVISSIALMDEHFDVTVEGRHLQNCGSPGELLALIQEKA